MIDSSFFQLFIFTDFSTNMLKERKFVSQKSLTTDTLSSNIHLILVSKKTATKEHGKEDRMSTTKLWDSQQHAQRMEDVNFCSR